MALRALTQKLGGKFRALRGLVALPLESRLGAQLTISGRARVSNLHTSGSVSSVSGTSPSAAGFNNYEEEKRTFRLEKPEYYNFATDMIDKWAKTDASRNGLPAFWWVGEDGMELKWSFTDLAINSRRVANILRGPMRLDVADRILVILPKVPAWWLMNIAAIRAGVILIPGTTQLTLKDIRLRLETSQCRAVVTFPENASKVEEAEADFPGLLKSKLLVGGNENRTGWLNYKELYNNASPDFEAVKTKADDPMTIFFTSGTTGLPKMCVHTHASYGLAHYISGKYWMDLTPRDVIWALSDTGWAKAAWGNVFCSWIHGACVFVNAESKFDPVQTLRLLQKYPISVFCAPPTAYRFMILEKLHTFRFKRIRHCLSAGEPLNPEVTEDWFAGTNFTIREGYGQTETVLQSAAYRCMPNKPGSMGLPPPGMDVQVIDDDLNPVGDNVEGNIAVKMAPERPVGVFKEYVNNPEKNASVFRGDFYLTGDRAYRDEDGYLWFVGRDDDVIMSAGYRIGPFEVESALIEHPAVAESAVVSSPDPQRGEIVKAFVVLKGDYKDQDNVGLTEDIQRHVKTITAPYKYPRKVEFVHDLPKTISGKIRRVELREREWGPK